MDGIWNESSLLFEISYHFIKLEIIEPKLGIILQDLIVNFIACSHKINPRGEGLMAQNHGSTNNEICHERY